MNAPPVPGMLISMMELDGRMILENCQPWIYNWQHKDVHLLGGQQVRWLLNTNIVLISDSKRSEKQ